MRRWCEEAVEAGLKRARELVLMSQPSAALRLVPRHFSDSTPHVQFEISSGSNQGQHGENREQGVERLLTDNSLCRWHYDWRRGKPALFACAGKTRLLFAQTRPWKVNFSHLQLLQHSTLSPSHPIHSRYYWLSRTSEIDLPPKTTYLINTR